MKLRNGKIVIDMEKVLFEKLEKFKNVIGAPRFHLYIDFYYEVPEFIFVVNKYLDNIDTFYVKNKKNKFDKFLIVITELEQIVKTLRNFNEGRYAFLRDTLDKNIKISIKKIEEFKKKYKKEINEVLCRLSCQIGIDNTKVVESYLQAF